MIAQEAEAVKLFTVLQAERDFYNSNMGTRMGDDGTSPDRKLSQDWVREYMDN